MTKAPSPGPGRSGEALGSGKVALYANYIEGLSQEIP